MRHKAILLVALVWMASLVLMAGAGSAYAADNTYTVQSGDTLSGIAAKFNITVSAIAQANGIANVNNIITGQVLKIPTTDAAAKPTQPTQTTGEIAYLVQAGDSLTSVANKYGVSIYDLAKVNNLSVMSYLYIGQTIKIPGQAKTDPQPSQTTSTPIVVTATQAPATTTEIVVTTTSAPTTTTPAPTTVAPVTTKATVNAVTTKYIVEAGDTLSSIAARFGVTVSAIVDANGLSNPNVISVGQELIIPGANSTVKYTPKPTTVVYATLAPSGGTAATGKWIDVNLSTQRLTAYEDGKAVYSSLVSTGISRYPTVTGTFNIYIKLGSQAMTGGTGRDYYYLPNVPYVMYFYQSYAIHGTYWHNNFGTPMSHGCVNLPTPAAQWMYNWAPMGTAVKVHY